MALRNGEDVSSNWVQNTDRLCETGHFSEDSLLYRGAAMRMDQIDAMLKNGGFLDPAYMSTSPERDTAEIYADIRIRENPTAASQKVIFTLKVPANGPTFGRMDNSEYVLARGGKISITGVRRPTADKEQWEIFGEVS
jgi:hypothetical protein